MAAGEGASAIHLADVVRLEVRGLSGDRLCDDLAAPRAADVAALRGILDDALPNGLAGSDAILYEGELLASGGDQPFEHAAAEACSVTVVFGWSVRFSGAVVAEEVAAHEPLAMRSSRGRLPTPFAGPQHVRFAPDAAQPGVALPGAAAGEAAAAARAPRRRRQATPFYIPLGLETALGKQ